MNFYPSWIHRIPEMIEALGLLTVERIDRPTVESLFDLRKTAAFHLLRRLGAERCGNSLVIGRAHLMARLREMQEHPDWCWERQRRAAVRARVENLHPTRRRSVIQVDARLRSQIDQLAAGGLPDTIQFGPGCLIIRCCSMEHLVEQLVLVAKALDTDYETIRIGVESTSARKPAEREHATTRSSSQAG
jgi:hypothetical protein